MWEDIVQIAQNIEEATVFVNSFLCSGNDKYSNAAIRVTTEEDGKEKTIFKSKKYLTGDYVYFVLKAYAQKVCHLCSGNGDVYNEFQQPSLCIACKGEGNIKKELNRLRIVGPCTVETIGNLEEINKDELAARNRVNLISDDESQKYIQAITNEYTKMRSLGVETAFQKKQRFAVPLIKCFIDEYTAERYVNEFNGFQVAREASKRSFS